MSDCPRVARCAHPFCRTSVTEDDAMACPHGHAVCPGCFIEEVCEECGAAA